MYPDRPPDSNPAIEFCAMISGKEHTPGGSGAFAVLDESSAVELNTILSEYALRGATAELVRRARTFLISYRSMLGDDTSASSVLSAEERAQLDRILDLSHTEDARRTARATATPRTGFKLTPRAIGIIVVALMVAVAMAITLMVVIPNGNPPPQTGISQENPPLPIEPQVDTLQQLRQYYDLTHQLTPSAQSPQTGAPGLLLLDHGNYFVSNKWTIPVNLPAWQQDMGSRVSSVEVHGDHVFITDADGNPYIVGIDQPFVFSIDPTTVIRVTRSKQVLTLDLATQPRRQHYKRQ